MRKYKLSNTAKDDFPYSFESVDFIKKGYRRCTCGADNIYYKINTNIVEIMAIIGRQNVKKIL